ncbi:hypothetical protein G6F64_015633 [Rhizopus arrhizus]|uniref:Uncharacterized protein n=1 Tax=Rhizopus oryzae TaxID=64495 RepID=A0A9P7BIN0_RHIOR|nr:hypothetical protein G6F31_020637 [Rhizopus arrhizus]KAG1270654.1 hypothetical protein G6F64_015633 [Rhizopus arrhizus]
MVRGQQHGLVAGQVGLRGQHVQALGARDAGGGLERESDQSCTGHLLQAFGIKRIEHADHDRAGLHVR